MAMTCEEEITLQSWKWTFATVTERAKNFSANLRAFNRVYLKSKESSFMYKMRRKYLSMTAASKAKKYIAKLMGC